MKDNIQEVFSPSSNIILTSLNNKALSELIDETNEYRLIYRPKLFIKKDTTFGIEIEYQSGGKKKPQENINNLELGKEWEIKRDASVPDGGELATPILHNTLKEWETLDYVCNALKLNAEVGPEAGGHIHIGTNVLDNKTSNWIKFLYLWIAYEHVIIRFTNGEYVRARKGLSRYAEPTSKILFETFKDNENIIKKLLKYNGNPTREYRKLMTELLCEISANRYRALNLDNASLTEEEDKNTFEFRCPNATLEQTIWQNNINLFANMLEHVEDIDIELLKDKIKRIESSIITESLDYNGLDLKSAIELCDLVFDHTIDKIYFLRQYIKDFAITTKQSVKCKFY